MASPYPVSVRIGASAGGLDACTRLVSAIGAGCGMAFVLVQHLDPTHASMMTELLSGRTVLTVREAEDGVRLEPDDRLTLAAPFGLDDVFAMTLRPNPNRPLAKDWERVVERALARWRQRWSPCCH